MNSRRILCALALFLACLVSNAQAAAPRPNIIIILSDDVGYSDVGCYGGEIQTPNLDRLASNGIRFTQFYNTGRCCPTRASLLTGLYPHQAGVGHMVNDRGHDGYRGELNRQCVTIPEVLRPAGYSSYMVGKWHVTRATDIKPEGPKHTWPLQRGFERFYGTIAGAGNYFDPATLTRDNTMLSAITDPEYRPKQYYYTDALSDHAVRFIREHRERAPEKPFFLYVAFTAAHWPLHALEEDIAKYRGKYDAGYEPVQRARLARMKEVGLLDPKWMPAPLKGNWASVSNKAWEARCMEVYAAQIERMDRGIGQIVEELRRTAMLDNTLITYLQDNGGCAEGMGRGGKDRRGAQKKLPVIADDFPRTDYRPKQTRDGRPVLQGPQIMPGPDDTFIAYGEAWANVSNTPFREYKHWVHEGGISTPLIVHWPRGVAKSRRGKLETQPAHLIDLMATCVDLGGATYQRVAQTNSITPMEGTSLAPAFKGKSLRRHEPIFFEHEGNRAVRDGRWKLVAKENKPWELYDMKNDRTEMNDLASKEPKRVQELSAQWDGWAARANVLPLGAWRARNTNAPLSIATNFVLTSGDNLDRESAPNVSQRAFTVTAKFDSLGSDGVIVAQGGSVHGYSLYVQNGRLFFALRRANALTLADAGKISPGLHTAKARLAKSGELSLTLDDQPPAIARAAGLLTQMPGDGLHVGSDEGGLVGPYGAENDFGGRIEFAEVILE